MKRVIMLILLMLGGTILNGTPPIKVDVVSPTKPTDSTPTKIDCVSPTKLDDALSTKSKKSKKSEKSEDDVAPTKKILEAKIRSLANDPVPTRLVSNVSEPIDPLPDKITYHCPICEKDTVHIRPSVVYRHSMWPISLLGYMKNDLAEVIKKSSLPMSFDERAFCKFCAEGKNKNSVFIEIEVEGKTVRNEYQNNDLRILNAFFSNRNDVDIQRGSGFRAYPLKNYIRRIQTLLGLE